jgi:hypothetical protein
VRERAAGQQAVEVLVREACKDRGLGEVARGELRDEPCEKRAAVYEPLGVEVMEEREAGQGARVRARGTQAGDGE